jgi:DNA-binding NarL/FixJ family response regulator
MAVAVTGRSTVLNRPRVLVADDHTIVAEGLRSLLEPEFELVGMVQDGRTLVSEAKKIGPEVIVLDISMPLLNGIEAARQIRKFDARVKLVFLTMHPDVAFVREAFRVGASAYLLKRAAASELVTAIRETLNGRSYLTPLITQETLQFFLNKTPESATTQGELTARQREVLQLVAEGHSIKEIASILHVSPKTAAFHKYRIMDQLGLRTTAELTQYAIKHGIVSS